jgi:N-acetylglucosaminyl-diphospho-decaprenol L-rhamnosyltransferase
LAETTFTNVIVSHNSRADLPALLGDLRRYAPSSHTIVIDNASTDGTPDLVRAQFPEVQLVSNAENVGYARAVNQGFGMCATPDVFLLNPDIRIHGPELFALLSECLHAAPCVAVTGPLQFKDALQRKDLTFTWSYLTPRALKLYVRFHLGSLPGHVEPLHVSFLNAGCIFVRRSAFGAVGGLNERYFLYGEEPDLFLKLQRRDYQCWLVADASVTHAREQSLQSVPSIHRLFFKLVGLLNIADAVIRGVVALLVDRLTGRRPPNSCRP